jgi:hypothetical protein
MLRMGDLETEYRQALALRAAGRLEEALQAFDALVRRYPAVAQARQMRGLTLCHLERFDEGMADMRAAIAMAPRTAAFHCDLGMILFVLDRGDEAHAEFKRALMLSPGDPDALSNLSLVLRARGDFAGAEQSARRAIAGRADFPQAHLNLATALLPQGKFAEAWRAYGVRPSPWVNLRDPRQPAGAPHVDRLPEPSAPLVLHGEQGLGDTLFFLRFAPALRARGHRLAFWGDPRLEPLLRRTGLFEHFIRGEAVPAEGLAVAWVGDLPGMLGETDPAAFPPALPIPPEAPRTALLRTYLERLGAAPYVGLTWRAGLDRRGRIGLAKGVPAEALARALSGVRGTFISLQRGPAAGEVEAFAAALGAPVHDGAALNDRLEDALAAMALMDEYVGVSNTNTHLRASAGRAARVLVPWPPEWRWMHAPERSPWFPAMPLYRQSRGGDWAPALARLRDDLASLGG